MATVRWQLTKVRYLPSKSRQTTLPSPGTTSTHTGTRGPSGGELAKRRSGGSEPACRFRPAVGLDRGIMRRATLAVLACSVAMVTACSSPSHSTATSGVDAQVSPVPVAPSSSAANVIAVELVWTHFGKFFGDDRATFVARVTNNEDAQASVALDARALDSTGTIVGSTQSTLPNIQPHSSFDFYGEIGGGISGALTGKPTKVEVTQADGAFGQAGGVLAPLLATSQVKLVPGDPSQTDTDARYAYDLTVTVENNTDQPLTTGVTQQVVLLDSAGKVVGGGTGSSDNVPATLKPGEKYRESWTGIPAQDKAVKVQYSVWPS
jgi:uncharacterized protein affecting Mg2+/Co2+ transport